MTLSRFLLPAILAGVLISAPAGFAQSAPTFSQVVVFGDSLSDNGNIRHRLEDDYGISYPGGDYNYSDGRFTNSSDTDPSTDLYSGTWHEQLERDFLMLPNGAITNSLDGGTNYAFGGATTADGTIERTVISNPDPFVGGELSVDVDNIGKQVDDYIAGELARSRSSLYHLGRRERFLRRSQRRQRPHRGHECCR